MSQPASVISNPWPHIPNVSTEVCDDDKSNADYIGDDMPARRTGELSDFDDHEERREFRRAMTALAVAQTQALNAPKATNGKSDTIRAWAPTVLTCLVLAVAFVRFDTTRENTATRDISDLKSQSQQIIQNNNQLRADFDKERTWWEKVRSNLSANGWLIDPDTGTVSRVRRAK